ncbi:DeoR/GlpR family DNA-binding transcription regulator [Roseibium sp.]|uniref:DeoR/GlpR family DNA-binding transcription regulator n=1 Tax=Roseibium sp. TaxID=1936156 RepID=UPI003B52D198
MSNVSHLPEQRRAAILKTLDGGEPVFAADLAREFSVSEDAIRRDLRKLAAEGLCEKVYGGAMPLRPVPSLYSERAERGQGQKRALARAALPLITKRQCLYLDAGSTNAALTAMLPDDLDLTVVTNSVPVLSRLMERDGITVYALGGLLNPQIGGTTGVQAVADVSLYRFDLAFLGACGLSRNTGLSIHDGEEAALKRAVLKNSSQCAALVTSEKLGTCLAHKVAAFDQVDYLVLESDVPLAERENYSSGTNTLLFADEPRNRAGGTSS